MSYWPERGRVFPAHSAWVHLQWTTIVVQWIPPHFECSATRSRECDDRQRVVAWNGTSEPVPSTFTDRAGVIYGPRRQDAARTAEDVPSCCLFVATFQSDPIPAKESSVRESPQSPETRDLAISTSWPTPERTHCKGGSRIDDIELDPGSPLSVEHMDKIVPLKHAEGQ